MRRTLSSFGLIVLIALGLAADASTAMANWCAGPINPAPDPPDGPDHRCDPDCKCTNSPCYLGLGAYTVNETDLRVKTTAGFPLIASRRYVSTHVVDGPMGIGWTPTVVSRISYATFQYSGGVYQKRAYVLMPEGMRLKFTENANGSYSPPPGRFDTLVKNADATFDLTMQHSLAKIHFTSTGQATSIWDDYGNRLNITNAAPGGKVSQIADMSGSGRYLSVTWGADGRIATIGDSSGRLVQYFYDADGALGSVTNPLGQTTSYDYDQGRFGPLLAQTTDHWGRVVSEATYESGTDRVLTYREDGELYTLSPYGTHGTSKHPESLPAGQTWDYVYDSESGLLTDIKDTVEWEHREYYPQGTAQDGLLKELVDRVNVHTFYTYDASGRLATVTRNKNALNTNSVRFDYTYDPLFPSRVTSIAPKKPADGTADPDWLTWNYDYYQPGSSPSPPGALFKVRRNGTSIALATYVYDVLGRVTQLTPAVGGATNYAYDASGNLATVTLPANNDAGTRPLITYGYDALGRVTSITDPLGRITTYSYDALDRISSVTLPAISTTPGAFTTGYSYDNFDAVSGLLFTRITDPNGIVSQRGFNQFEQLVKVLDGLSRPTATYAYVRGLIASITDANNYTTDYAYDGGNRLSSTSFPDGTSETYTSYVDGMLASVTRGSQRTDYGYDPYKRLTAEQNFFTAERFSNTYVGQKLTKVEETGASGSVVETHTMLYDATMRLTRVTNSRGVVAYNYDNADRRTSTTAVGPPDVTTTYGYYPDTSVKTLTWTATTPSSVFTYLYDLAGRATKLTFPQGQHRDYAYDEQGRLTSLATKTNTNANLATYTYGYDLNYTAGTTYDRKGQRVSLSAAVPALNTYDGLHKYEYDSVYELTKDTFPNLTSVNWAYDAVGNRISGGSLTYNYQKIGANPNNWQRLLSDSGGRSWTYDGRGNEATQSATGANYTYTFDWRNHLSALSGSSTASYVYDRWDRRSSKTVSATKTNYLYAGEHILQEKNATLAVTADYLMGIGIDEPIAMRRGGSVYYYVVDGLGSVRLVTNISNAVQDKYQWDAWGNRTSTGADPVASPFGYTGREIGDAQDHFYRARYYAPSIGRFLAEDPLRQRGDANLYAYAGDSPVLYRDPSGLYSEAVAYQNCMDRARQKYDWGATRCGDVYAACKEGCGIDCPFAERPPIIHEVCLGQCYLAWGTCRVSVAAASANDKLWCQAFKPRLSGARPGGDLIIPAVP